MIQRITIELDENYNSNNEENVKYVYSIELDGEECSRTIDCEKEFDSEIEAYTHAMRRSCKILKKLVELESSLENEDDIENDLIL